MVQKEKKIPKALQNFQGEDQLTGGTSFCTGCPAELVLRLVTRIMGKQTVMVGTPSCSAPVLHGQNLGAWHKLAYYSCVMTGVPSSATGIARYYKKIGRKDVNVVCFTGDGAATDIGFQALSGAAERNENLIYICYDNEGYMNTGNQRSSSTPLGASTSTTPIGADGKGKVTAAKYTPLLIALHPVAYAATATLSHPDDFARKLLKAREKKNEGFAYVHVFCPCPVGWRTATDAAIEICRTAVRTNYFPLWEMEGGKFRLNVKVDNPKPISELTRLIGKFSHFKEAELARLQEQVNDRYNLVKTLCEAGEKKAG